MKDTARTVLLALVAAVAAVQAFAEARPADTSGLRFELAVNPRLMPFVDLLETPAYVGAVLENSGYSLMMSTKAKILKRGRAVRAKYVALTFIGRDGLRFNYEAEIDANLGLIGTRVAFPVVVDAGDVSKGRIFIVLSSPMAGALPDELTDRIQLRAQQMASPGLQESVVSYLEGLAGRSGFSGSVDTLFVPILSDSYNLEIKNAPASGREPGDAEPLADQILLIVTLVIWLLVVPAGIAVWRYRSRRARASR